MTDIEGNIDSTDSSGMKYGSGTHLSFSIGQMIKQFLEVALIPISDMLDDLKFHIINGPAAKMTVEFSTKSRGKVDLTIAEWVFHKVRDL